MAARSLKPAEPRPPKPAEAPKPPIAPDGPMRFSPLHLLALCAATLAACGDDAAPDTTADAGFDGSGDGSGSGSCVAPLLDQPRTRLPVGTTFYLSAPVDELGCSPAEWAISESPAANTNDVVVGDDGYVRFTPHVAGTYTFTADGETAEELTVVDSAEVPFHNVNYYGSSSIAFVGGEVWTANVYAPTLTQLDAADLSVIGTVDVGPWPVALAWHEDTNTVVVAQKANDTLGFVDVESGHIVDAVWVGDEPSNVVVAQSARLAFVALATDGQVAVVDIANRAVVARVDVGPDPLGLALTADESTLAVATHRSGQANRAPYDDTPVENERDVAIVDVATRTVSRYLIDVGTTINGLTFADDGDTLVVANTRNDTEATFVDGDVFMHEVVRYSASTGERIDAADVGTQESSGGYAVFVHTPALDGSHVWVPGEGNDVVVQLDADTLDEVARFDAGGRPRAVVAHDGVAYVHGAQGFVVTRIAAEGAQVATASTGTDPRPEDLAEGQAFFTGAGRTYGESWGCQGCHVDGLTDTLVWRVGPFPEFEVPRPIFWAEGTEPLGWTAYVSSPEAFALAGPVNIGVRTVTDEAEALGAYVASLMPAPAANSQTERDGSLTVAAERGRELFYGEAGCVSCHGGPTATNQAVFEDGITPGRTDVPSLVGVYRFGTWLKDGSALTLEDSVRAALDYIDVTSLDDAQIADLTRYLQEWTASEFFVLDADPEDGEAAFAADAPVVLTFSYPVWDAAANLARISLVDADGAAVDAAIEADARHVTITPTETLAFGADYTVVIDATLESFDEKALSGQTEFAFTTAAAPALRLEGEYVLTFAVPAFDFENAVLDPETTVATPIDVVATANESGAIIVADLLQGLTQTVRATTNGDQVWIEPIAIPAGPFSLGDSSGFSGTLVDADDDGIADSVEAGTTVFSGPGFRENIGFTFAREEEGGCEPGANGQVAVTLTRGEDGTPVVSWDGAQTALGFYVTDPGARLPTLPGTTVQNGMAYWVLEANNFPTGFSGPMTYGVVPEFANQVTENHGGEPGAAELVEGQCYQFSVTRSDFRTGNVVVVW